MNEFLLPVPPTAVWIGKKDQHLLSSHPTRFSCHADGSSPRTRFAWWIGDRKVAVATTSNANGNNAVKVSYVCVLPGKKCFLIVFSSFSSFYGINHRGPPSFP